MLTLVHAVHSRKRTRGSRQLWHPWIIAMRSESLHSHHISYCRMAHGKRASRERFVAFIPSRAVVVVLALTETPRTHAAPKRLEAIVEKATVALLIVVVSAVRDHLIHLLAGREGVLCCRSGDAVSCNEFRIY